MEGLVEVRADHEVCCLEACLDGGAGRGIVSPADHEG